MPWKNLTKLKDHGESSEHRQAASEPPGGNRGRQSSPKCEVIKMEVDDKMLQSDKIHIKNEQVGQDIVSELKALRTLGPGPVKIVCSDKSLHTHLEPLLLSTRLFRNTTGIFNRI